jgi:hypothetical protein
MVVLDATWFDRTFSSRSQAETVLRPYLEEGTINDHDYNLAVSFLPGKHRYWPVCILVKCPQGAPFRLLTLLDALQRWRHRPCRCIRSSL